MFLYFLDISDCRGAGGGKLRLAHAIVGKIDRRLGPAQGGDQRGPPALIKIGQGAVILAQGLAQLGRGFGIHQIGHGFRPGQVQLAIFHRPAAEFARLGRDAGPAAKAPNKASRIARPPWIWNSATSSPVKLSGLGLVPAEPGDPAAGRWKMAVFDLTKPKGWPIWLKPKPGRLRQGPWHDVKAAYAAL